MALTFRYRHLAVAMPSSVAVIRRYRYAARRIDPPLPDPNPTNRTERVVSLPRILFALGLLVGYTWAAWLRFDRDARGMSVAVVLASLAVMGCGAWVRAGQLRADRRALGRSGPRDASSGAGQDDSVEALVAWDRAQQAAGTEQVVRRGPMAHGLGLVPVAYFWVGTVGLLLAPERILPFVSSAVPRFVIAAASAAAVSLVLALALGLYGWMRARSRSRRGAVPTLGGLP
jgi:hypothetical protein